MIIGGAVSAFGQPQTGGYKSASVSDAGVKEAADGTVVKKAAEMVIFKNLKSEFSINSWEAEDCVEK